MGIELVKVVQTSTACPTQFDAWDRNGQYYYLRFRHGIGTVHKFQSPEDMTMPSKDNLVCEFAHGHPLDGCITLEEFTEKAGLRIAEDAEIKAFNEMMFDAISEAFRETYGVNL